MKIPCSCSDSPLPDPLAPTGTLHSTGPVVVKEFHAKPVSVVIYDFLCAKDRELRRS